MAVPLARAAEFGKNTAEGQETRVEGLKPEFEALLSGSTPLSLRNQSLLGCFLIAVVEC